jgi:hypothetical protein
LVSEAELVSEVVVLLVQLELQLHDKPLMSSEAQEQSEYQFKDKFAHKFQYKELSALKYQFKELSTEQNK